MRTVIIIFLLASLGMTAQVKESRSASDFNRVKVSQGIELNYKVSSTIKIVVEVENKAQLEGVITEVSNKVLKVYIKSNKNSWGLSGQKNQNVKVFVEGPNLDGVTVSSSAMFVAENTIKTTDFTVEVSSSGLFKGDVKSQKSKIAISSSGKVNGNFQATDLVDINTSSSAYYQGTVSAKELKMGTSSSSKIEVSGDVNRVKSESSSSSKIKATELKAKTVTAVSSSSSSASFSVSDSIDAKATSSGKIHYVGNPTHVNVTKSSSGKVTKA